MFDEEFRVAAGAGGEGVVAVVGGRVDGDHVGAVGQGAAAEELQVAVVFGQHGEGAAFGGDVEPAGGVVEGEHVGVGADLDGVAHLQGVQVQGVHGGVAVAGDEAEPVRRVQGQAVRVLAAGHGNAAGHSVGVGVDDGDLVAGLDVDQDPAWPAGGWRGRPALRGGTRADPGWRAGPGVVGDVASVPADIDGGQDRLGGGVQDGLRAAGLIGDPHLVAGGVVGQPVGVGAGGRASQDGPGVLVQGEDLVEVGGGGEHPTQ